MINLTHNNKLIGVIKWAYTKYKQVLKYYQEKDEKESKIPEYKAYKLIIPYLLIQGCDEIWKTLEKLKTQANLGNNRKYDDDGTNYKRKNVINTHIIEYKNKQYSHGQVNQNSNRLLMDNGSLIMIVNNPKLVQKSCHPHGWTFDAIYNNCCFTAKTTQKTKQNLLNHNILKEYETILVIDLQVQ